MPAHPGRIVEAKRYAFEKRIVRQDLGNQRKRMNSEPGRKGAGDIGFGIGSRDAHVRLPSVATVGKSSVRILGGQNVPQAPAQRIPDFRSTIIQALVTVDEYIHRIHILTGAGIPGRVKAAIMMLKCKHRIDEAAHIRQSAAFEVI